MTSAIETHLSFSLLLCASRFPAESLFLRNLCLLCPGVQPSPGLPPTPLAHGAQVKAAAPPPPTPPSPSCWLFPVSRLQNLQRPGEFHNVTRDLRSPLLSLQPGKAPNLPVTRTIQLWLRTLNTQSQPPPLLTLIQLPSFKNSPFSANHFYHSLSQ